MDQQQKEELWVRYSSVWRNVLTHVLEWRLGRVDSYIEELRREMEARINDPFDFGFFYDPPTRYLFRALLEDGLHERIMQCKSDEANPHLIYQRLVRATTGDQLEREMDKEGFDWSQARQRYQSERRKIEEWLAAQAKI
jgi:hypothetical protein